MADEKPRIRVQAQSVPTAKAWMTGDSFANVAARLGVTQNNQLSQSTYVQNAITRNRMLMDNMYRGSWVVGAVVDSVAEDMVRAGVELMNCDPSDIDEIQDDLKATGTWEGIEQTLKWGRLYGGAIGVMMIDGQDPASPLIPETVGKGQFRGVFAMDRWLAWNAPSDFVGEMGPDFGAPTYYDIQPVNAGYILPWKRVHYSRVIRHVGAELPIQQRMYENGWGMSVVERMFDRMVAFDSATTGAAQMVFRAHLRTLSIDGLRELIAAGGTLMEAVLKNLDLIRQYQSLEGLTLLDAKDKYETHSYTFAGMTDIILQLAQQIAGATQIPLTRLFGQSPAGLNATGESDMRNYYDMIRRKQESGLRRSMTTILDVTHRSRLGRPPESDFGFKFESLWQMDDAEKATIAQNTVTAVTGAYSAGIITSRATALKELKQSSDVTGVFSNISAEEIEEAEDEPPPLPEGHSVDATGQVVPTRSLEEQDQEKASIDRQFTGDDATSGPLYLSRPVTYKSSLEAWAKAQNFDLAGDPHVTVVYSRAPVDWFTNGTDFASGDGKILVNQGGPRKLARMGDKLALLFASDSLQWRHRQFREAGASHDYPRYMPHVLICDWTEGADDAEPYQGEIELGPEVFDDLD